MKKYDLTSGPVLRTLIVYSFPLIVTNLVQLLFHAADIAVLGMMADDGAVAAVGACGPIVSLLVSLFSGLATGANVLVAKCVGAKFKEDARRAVGVSLLIGLLAGLILMITAMIGARQFLIWINCSEEILDDAVLYMRIYFTGMPITMMYNFIAAILRAVGDSKKPMNYMLAAGTLNVFLNIIFICVFHMAVAGVALATVISNGLSLVLALSALIRNEEYCRIERKNLRLRKNELWQIVRVGVPASFGGLCFFTSNIFVSASVNLLGTDVMTANTVSSQFDGIVYNIGMSVALGCMSMVGQALGAQNAPRISRIVRIGSAYATILSLCVGCLFVLFAKPLLGIITDTPDIIALASKKLTLLGLTYFITSIMEVHSFSLNAMQRSHLTAAVCLICGFGVRTGWVLVAVPTNPSLVMIYLSYPVSALCAILLYIFACRDSVRRLSLRFGKEKQALTEK